MSLPAEVVYAVVYHSDQPRKATRGRSFSDYVEFTDVGARLSDKPTLFSTREIAEQFKKNKIDLPADLQGTYRVVPIRLLPECHVPANQTVEEHQYAVVADARTLALGLLHYNDIANEVKKIAGKVLTILDAAYVNDNQNKAVKDLVKASFRSQLGEMWNKAFRYPNEGVEECESKRMEDILD